jgi:hypothetical protein
MRVFISRDANWLYEAKSWVGDRAFRQLLDDLDLTCQRLEREFGECCAFVETPLPVPKDFPSSGSRNQVDLVLCFDKQAALCELKRHRRRQLKVEECVEQIRRQQALLNHLIPRHLQPTISPFLLTSALDLSELDDVAAELRSQHAAQHMWVTTAAPLAGGDDDYLPRALERRLKSGPRRAQSKMAVQSWICELIRKDGDRLLAFESFTQLREYLERNLRLDAELRFDKWHVAGARSETLVRARTSFVDCRFVEIVGTPGSGKSTFAKEMLNDMKDREASLHFIDESLPTCDSPEAVCREILSAIHEMLPGPLGYDTLLQWLARQPFIIWVSRYDAATAPHLAELVLSTVTPRSDASAKWIIESTEPIPRLNGSSHSLGPLDGRTIYSMLRRGASGGAYSDPDQVVQRAGGRPKVAIRFWESADLEAAESAGQEAGWFVQYLQRRSQTQARLLPILCTAVAASPLCLPVDALAEWANVAFAHSHLTKRELRSAMEGLLEQLEARQLARVTRLHQSAFEILGTVLPSDHPFAVVNRVDSSLLRHVLDSLPREQRIALQDAYQSFLRERAHDPAVADTLLFVTLALNEGDIGPFLDSSFRHTSRERVTKWLEDQAGQTPLVFARQAQVVRALRMLRQVVEGRSLSRSDILEEIGSQTPQSPVERRARELLLINATLRPLIDPKKAGVDEFERTVAEARVAARSAPSVESAETAYLASLSFMRHGQYREAWDVLQEALGAAGYARHARLQLIIESLAYLNRKKLVTLPSGEAIDEVITRLATEGLQTAFAVHDVQAICDILFYHSRHLEFQAGRTGEDVLAFLDGFRFIEENQFRRRRRAQLLMTQGSVHRHAARNDRLTWPEFRFHVSESFHFYSRVLASAEAADQITYLLNSVAYQIDLFYLAVRYANEPEAWDLVISICHDAYRNAQSLISNPKLAASDGLDATMLRNIHRAIPLLLYSRVAANSHPSPSDENALGASFDQLTKDVETSLRGVDYGEGVKLAVEVTKRVNRVIAFVAAHDRERDEEMRRLLKPQLRGLLSATQRYAGKKRDWNDLNNLVA